MSKKDERFKSVTRFLFVTTQFAALVWVSISYFIAAYATIVLQQPFPVVELSKQAIVTILGVTALKVLENIFEHNDGVIFGTSNDKDSKVPVDTLSHEEIEGADGIVEEDEEVNEEEHTV